HFLALAYLAWVAVGPGGEKLHRGFQAIGAARPAVLWAAGAFAALTIPYAYLEEIAALSPALDGAFLHLLGEGAEGAFGVSFLIATPRLGLIQLLHLVALLILGWAAIGAAGRAWVVGPGFLATVPVIRKVGTQSLAVFLVSMILARASGMALDVIGRSMFTTGAVNLAGFGVLIATAYGVGWFRSQPWRRRVGAATSATPAATGPARPDGARAEIAPAE
ncbi:MAG: OpgC domain-containing protein, partial [Pseudomonadota bacterium]